MIVIADAPFSNSQSAELTTIPTMAEQLSREDRLKLILQNLQEVLKPDIIEHVVLKEDRPLKIYWGTAKYNQISTKIADDSRYCDHWSVGVSNILYETPISDMTDLTAPTSCPW